MKDASADFNFGSLTAIDLSQFGLLNNQSRQREVMKGNGKLVMQNYPGCCLLLN